MMVSEARSSFNHNLFVTHAKEILVDEHVKAPHRWAVWVLVTVRVFPQVRVSRLDEVRMDDEVGGVGFDDGGGVARAEDVREVGTDAQRRHGHEVRRARVLLAPAHHADLASLALVLGWAEGRHHGTHSRR